MGAGLRVDGHRVGVRLEAIIYTGVRGSRKAPALPDIYAEAMSSCNRYVLRGCDQLAQDVGQDAAVPVIVDLYGCIDA